LNGEEETAVEAAHASGEQEICIERDSDPDSDFEPDEV
jgi:hypothetical protein